MFVDTGVWYAALDSSDRHHQRAREILGDREPLLLTDYVLLETWRLAAHRLGYAVAERFFGTMRAGAADVAAVTPVDRESAWAIGQMFPDKELSMTDRTSFAVMERLGLVRVATFDSDFALYRYGEQRRRAFEVVT